MIIDINNIPKKILNNDKKNLILFDIDNTLLLPQNIYIYYEKDGIKKKYTPEEYAKINVSVDIKKYYDYRDFHNAISIKNSIKKSIPLVKNLNFIKEFITNNSFVYGILTARGNENVVNETIVKWLQKNLLNTIDIKRKFVFAINDNIKKYNGNTDSEKKLNVLKILKNKYNLIFIDDNIFTLKLIASHINDILLIHAK